MSYKDPEKQKKAQHEWYLKNKDITRDRARQRRAKTAEWLLTYKITLKCTRCGYEGKNNPKAIVFHHVNPLSKGMGISNMVRQAYDINLIIKEIEKCEILCRNCHRKIHYEKYINSNRKRINRYKYYEKLKKEFECEQCGEKDIACLDFHHIVPEEKITGICKIVNKRLPLEFLLTELEKCICLCANCHAKETYK